MRLAGVRGGGDAHSTALAIAFAALALALLAMTLRWLVPMMLWDHLDLVPMLQAAREGALGQSIFWDIHGGHLHSAAYAVLLATTWLSGGQPWLDCVASWILLVAYAAIVLGPVRRAALPAGTPLRWHCAILLFALYPGHLANLQWGWQVAVFLCLLGAVLVIASLCAERLDGWRNAVALAGAILAWLSFATGIGLVPLALLLLAARRDVAWRRRLAFALPWGLLALAVGWSELGRARSSEGFATASQLAHYVLDYLGAGVARFATDVAPWLAVAALATGVHAFVRVRRERAALYWAGFAGFALFAAVLTALGRAMPFGADHAFVTRYVSFSSAFWLGWSGLMALAHRAGAVRRWQSALVVLVAVFALANALHMIGKAAKVGATSRQTAAHIRAAWPQVDDATLRAIYFEQPDVARERLRLLHDWSYAPFDRRGDAGAGGEPPR
jgi:hypothetical protein